LQGIKSVISLPRATEPTVRVGHTRPSGDVGSMSGLPESGLAHLAAFWLQSKTVKR